MKDARMSRILFTLLLIFLVAVMSSCKRGAPSEKPPIHINPNMDLQPKYKPQEESNFFADGSVNRLPVPGTVARNELRENTVYFYGKDAKGKFVAKGPVPYSLDVLKRGQERFNIYCSPCHSRVGDGKGIVAQRGFMPPPTFHQDRLRNMPDGQMFDIITNGFRNMPSYRHQIPVADRWAIVGYVRVLQRSQHASLNDIPKKLRNDIK